MLGAALGWSLEKVNEVFLTDSELKVGIWLNSNGRSNDLWQYRKYTKQHLSDYEKGKVDTPWFRSVIVKEMLFNLDLKIYLHVSELSLLKEIENALLDPRWALSLGKEDELLHIDSVDKVELKPLDQKEITFSNTVLPFDIYAYQFQPVLEDKPYNDLLAEAPAVFDIPIGFSFDKKGTRLASTFQRVSWVGSLPVKIEILENQDVFFYESKSKIVIGVY